MKPRQWRRSAAGKYLRYLPRIKNIRGTWLHRCIGDRLFLAELWQPDRVRFAAGCSIGVFCGLVPLPIQMIGAAAIAFFVRVNIPAAIAATWVSNPFTTPVFLYAEYMLGSFLLDTDPLIQPGGKFLDLAKSVPLILKNAPLPTLAGSVVIGAALAALAYPIAFWGWNFVTKMSLRSARRRGQKKSASNMEEN